jgi:hypothetical protein
MNQPEATAGVLRKLLTKCPACTNEAGGHRFAELATVIIGDQERPRLTAFFSHLRGHEWSKLIEFKDWRPDRDILVGYALRCPSGDGLVVAVKSPYELYSPYEIFLQEAVTPMELEGFNKLLPELEWRAI